jgi:hypothetical protein
MVLRSRWRRCDLVGFSDVQEARQQEVIHINQKETALAANAVRAVGFFIVGCMFTVLEDYLPDFWLIGRQPWRALAGIGFLVSFYYLAECFFSLIRVALERLRRKFKA